MVENLYPLAYGRVTGRFLAAVGDSSLDVDQYPDAVPVAGSVTFTPSASVLLVPSATPDPATVLPIPVTCDLDDGGYISRNGVRGVYLLATNDPSVNPTGYTYDVSFTGLNASGQSVKYNDFSIQVIANTTQDLAVLAPVGASAGVTITRGEKGAPGAGLNLQGTVATVATLPSNLGQTDANKGWIASGNGHLYVWTGTAYIDAGQFTGPANTISVGSVQQGSSASASITGSAPNQTLNLVLPAGAPGAPGAAGQDGGTGPAGPITSFNIGSVTTGDPSTPASVTITGTAPNLTLNFVVPQGIAGASGSNGSNGSSIADATSSTKGVVALSGDLTGQAASPALALTGVAAGTYGGATSWPTITVDSKGRITGASSTPMPALAASGVTAGTYGSSTSWPTFTVDSKGRVTSVSTVTAPTQQASSQLVMPWPHIGIYTATLADANAVIENVSTTGMVLFIPSHSTVPFPIGTVLEVCHYAASGSIVLTNPQTPNYTTVVSENFSGANGTQWSSQWTKDVMYGATGQDTQNLNGLGRYSAGTTAYGKMRQTLLSMPFMSDLDVTMQFRFNNQANDEVCFGFDSDYSINSNQSSYSNNGYFLQFLCNPTAANSTYELSKSIGGTITTPGAQTAYTFTAGTWYSFRLRRVGTTVQFRIWTGNTEPTSWTQTVTDTTQPAAGQCFITLGGSYAGANETIDLANLIINTVGVQLRSPSGYRLVTQYASAALRQRAIDEWVVAGNTVV